MVFLVRTIHGFISLFFLICIAYIYYAGVTNRKGLLAYLAIASVLVEGVIVTLNRGDCPLAGIHRRYGDNLAFFELFLPKRAAKLAIPFLGLVSAIGFILVIL